MPTDTKLTSDGAAAVNTKFFWIPVGPDTPRGVKLQLINRKDGVAHYGHYTVGAPYTHWQALPVFP